MADNDDQTIDFGYRQVPKGEKARHVAGVFDSVAARYDVMNDVMSLGVHRLWKRFAIERSGVRRGDRVLDLAGGSGDLAMRMARRVGAEGEVVLTDINGSMLQVGRQRTIDQGHVGNLRYAQVNAEKLPFADNHFDCVTIGFGLRNVTDRQAALDEMARVLKPGKPLLVLEFSRPVVPGLAPVYDAYSFGLLPLMGRLIAGDADSYRYLAESIRMHPDQPTLGAMLEQAGLVRCEWFNLSGGIVALHRGYKV